MAELLGMRIEKDGNEWVAILPPHPDMPDEELGLPAATREEAEAEGRAYRAIEQSSLYKFDFDERNGVYIVSIGKEGEDFQAPLLAEAYRQAQEAYAKRINEPPPPDPVTPPRAKPGRKPRQQPAPPPGQQRALEEQRTPTAPPQEATIVQPGIAPADLPPQITSGIGDKPGQLGHATGQPNPNSNPWELLTKRVDKLEMVLTSVIEATAQALEEMKRK